MEAILIVDGFAISRRAIANILSANNPSYEVLQAPNSQHLAQICQKSGLDPKVAIVDASHPYQNSLETFIHVKQAFPSSPTMVIGGSPDTKRQAHFLMMGCNAYLARTADRDEISSRFDKLLSSSQEDALKHPIELQDGVEEEFARLRMLTHRELCVLLRLALGEPTKAISHRLGVSSSTISIMKLHIMEKLNIKNHFELIKFALDSKLISRPPHQALNDSYNRLRELPLLSGWHSFHD
jgi:DNA-binding NarL/FixJ family response regulator